jgi:cytochrome c1
MTEMPHIADRPARGFRTGMTMMKKASLVLAALAAGGLALGLAARAQEAQTQEQEFEAKIPQQQAWSFSGPFGIYDTAQLQRGYKIYKDVCSGCHSMISMKFRNLSDPGGPSFSEAQVEALAATFEVQDGPNDQGKMFKRPGRPADPFPLPFPNEQMARRSFGGALPPDMSVLAKARSYERFNWFPADVAYGIWNIVTQYQTQGPDYISALLQGYKDPPKGVELTGAQSYNEVFAAGNGRISMPPPLQDGQIKYPAGPDGKPVVPETVAQYSKDVAAFLMWAAEPKLDQRKQLGLEVMLYLLVAACLMYFVKKKVWADAHA